jgi:hypothetical protein
MRYFPIKRIAVMTLGGVAFVLSWMPQFAAVFRISGINWVAITSGVLTICFAYWVIVDLYMKLESKPMLLVRSVGGSVLARSDEDSFPVRLEYFYGVLIINSSPDKTLGIIDIELQLKYKNKTKYILPYVGVPKSDFDNAKEGVISSPIRLQPNESREGTLAFVEERSEEKLLRGKEAVPDMNIIITDAQKRKYLFDARIWEVAKFPQGRAIK